MAIDGNRVFSHAANPNGLFFPCQAPVAGGNIIKERNMPFPVKGDEAALFYGYAAY